MVTVVVGINILISLLGFYTAWRLWGLRKRLKALADAIAQSQQQVHTAFQAGAVPAQILQGQQQALEWRQRYAQTQLQLRRAQQLWALINLLPLGMRLLGSRPNSKRRFGRKRRSFRLY